jgi:hypothetical protein
LVSSFLRSDLPNQRVESSEIDVSASSCQLRDGLPLVGKIKGRPCVMSVEPVSTTLFQHQMNKWSLETWEESSFGAFKEASKEKEIATKLDEQPAWILW